MSEWSYVSIEDAIRKPAVSKKNQILSSEVSPTGAIPVVDQGQAFIAGYSEDAEKAIKSDLPLIVFGDHTRCVKYVDFEFVLGADGTKVLKPREELFDPEFFYYALRSLEIPNRGYNRHYSLLKKMLIPVPDIGEQREIAKVLRVEAAAVDCERRLVDVAAELKEAALFDAFTKPWPRVSLGDCCVVSSGSLSYGAFLATAESDESTAETCMAVKVSDMNLPGNEREFVDANAVKRLSRNLARKKLIPMGAVVLPKRGAAIATNKKRLTTTWTALDPNLIALVPTADVIGEFLFQWVQTFDLRDITSPGPTPQLNKKDLVPLMIPLPPLARQHEIAVALSALDANVELHRSRLAALTELLESTMSDLMSGRLSVMNAPVNDEVRPLVPAV